MNYSSRKRKSSKNEKNPKNGFFLGNLRTLEMVGIGLILLAAILYMMSRCSGDRDNKIIEETVNSNKDATELEATTASTNTSITKPSYLYVCIDSFKLRNNYHLNDSIIAYLSFGEEVVDLHKKSDFEQTIKFSETNKATEPWIKVKTKKGKIGWVFGAGVRPYRKKGPEED